MPIQSVFEGDVPSWIHCELCERRDVQRQELFAVAEEQAGSEAAESVALVLLCRDCSALAEGAIDQPEWRRRTNRHSKKDGARRPLPVDKHLVMPN